ncbi:hypothetical protein A9P82_10485 [Arachidicoccus ginsenosidimutans]|uniref:LytR/AlgR family response regulator transcription factor n=1 Tax=Arachidicoccus sp. BS20 TaxID=1850526 RepID=UPI0007F10E22|nr:LytTR family DNA-binding domain-containing protein [Arachidicoccus sp. BS20]ANI89677.1 hypothetical protein A9P82_10485 [Arachidicoccus sp. BS20]
MIKCIIADSDLAVIEFIRKHLNKLPQFSVEAGFTDADSFINHLQHHPTDLAITDIQMPELNGYDFLQYLKKPPELIVIADTIEFSVNGYDHNVVAYLLKPLSAANLIKALQKTETKIKTLKLAEKRPESHQFLFIRAEYKLMKINFDDILYIEGLKDYSKIYTKASVGKAIITLQNLKSFEEKLPGEDFVRIHRSYIVSLHKIDMIHKNSVLIGKNEIPISDGFKNQLHNLISKYT